MYSILLMRKGQLIYFMILNRSPLLADSVEKVAASPRRRQDHDRSHALRGHAALDAPASTRGSCVLRYDAERHGLAPTPQSGPLINPLIGSIP